MPTLGDRELERRAAQLEWILCDVDGVLTDGRLVYDGAGEAMKRFHAHDGLGLKLAQRAGLKVGILSARSSPALDRRASELKLDVAITGAASKREAFEELLRHQGTSSGRVCYIGDDLTDLAVLGRCGLAFAPADAVREVRDVAHFVLERRGGAGAVREMVEVLLRARRDWQRVLAPFTLEA